MSSDNDVTRLLIDWRGGDDRALERLMPLVYEDLRDRAAAYLARERSDHTLQPTALVHEAFVRLVGQNSVDWQNRAHFLAVTARVMRQVLIDHARSRNAAKRGGKRITLSNDLVMDEPKNVDVVALDAALVELEKLDERQARVVELRFFGGLSIEETSEVLGISPATVKREWRMARAWLHATLAAG
jgi:RNA polymerase sigma factor (TIGR02999 family)